MMDIKIFTYGEARDAGREHYPFIKMKQSQEQYHSKIKFYIIFI